MLDSGHPARPNNGVKMRIIGKPELITNEQTFASEYVVTIALSIEALQDAHSIFGEETQRAIGEKLCELIAENRI